MQDINYLLYIITKKIIHHRNTTNNSLCFPFMSIWCLLIEEYYLNNQFSDNLFDNHNLQRKSSTCTETIAIER